MTMVWTPDPIDSATLRRLAERTVDRAARQKIREAFARASSDLKTVRPRNAGLCL